MLCLIVSCILCMLPNKVFMLSAAEEGLLAKGTNNAEQAVWDHRRSEEDSFVHHHYWSLSVVTSERKDCFF